MKRAQLIEWGLIVVALIFGYKFFEGILSLFIQIIYGFDRGLIASDILRSVLIIGLYAAAFILLIKNSDKVAAYLSGPDEVANALPVKIGKRSMLQVVLIAICISTILSGVSDIIYYLFNAFKKEVQNRGFLDEPGSSSPGKYTFIIHSIEILASIIIIYFSKNISDWFIRKDEADELVFESKPEN